MSNTKKDNKTYEELGYKCFYWMMKFIFGVAVITFASILIINTMDDNIEITIVQDNITKIEILEKQILSLTSKLEIEKEKSHEYNLIIQNQHLNYNNQNDRFDKMLNYTLTSKEELYGCYNIVNELRTILNIRYDWDGVVY